MTKRQIYLDYAAATPVSPAVQKQVAPFLDVDFYNPSATYNAGRQARQTLDAARANIASLLGARSSEILFTAGGSEANNLAIHGVMRSFPEANIVVSAIEHESVLAPAHRYNCREAVVAPDGRLDIAQMAELIDDHTVLVSVMYANNEIGAVQPLREVSQFLQTVRKQRQAAGNKLPIFLHSDACQAGNYLDLHVARLGLDLMTINGGKIYGPKQSGALYIKGGVQLQPLIDGGGQERGLRSGTESLTAAVGLSTALSEAQALRNAEVSRLKELQQTFFNLFETALPKAKINGTVKYRLPNNVHLTLPGQDNERLLMQLDEAGIMAAAGSACSASNDEPSHVLAALGLSDSEAQSSLRFTMGRATTIEEIETTVQALRTFVS
jgi:cysteine desulfurase